MQRGNILCSVWKTGYRIFCGNIGYVMETMRKSKAQEIALQNRLSILVSMTEKYRSTIYKMQRDSIDELAKNEKPKNVVNIINQSEN